MTDDNADDRRNEAAPTTTAPNSIKVLKGLDAVRKRPGMYIGDTDDGSGLHHMVYEVVDNAIDEALAGYATPVEVILNADGSATVTDDGRGIPTDIHEGEGVSAAEVIMTQLHAGGKFDQNSYKVSGGLHGVGVSVVNALSDWLELKIWRDGKTHEMRFERGDAVSPLKITGTAPQRENGELLTGTERHLPAVAADLLDHRVRPQDAGAPPARAGLPELRRDHPLPRPARGRAVRGDHALRGRGRGLRAPPGQVQDAAAQGAPIVVRGEREKVEIDLALWWNDSYHETMLCFTNNIPQRDGGTHLAAFRAALTRVIAGYVESSGVGQAREGRRLRRGRPRGPDLRAVGQGARPQVLVPDQGQAGLVRGAPGGGGPGRRGHRPMVRGASARGQAGRAARSSRPPPRARRPARRAN